MECEVCHLGPDIGVTLYRQNPLGETPAIWRCAEHSLLRCLRWGLDHVNQLLHDEMNVDHRDATRGLYGKFRVERVDGRSAPGEKHDGCDYFVLDLDHDPHSWPALKAYIESCREEFPVLADDLYTLMHGGGTSGTVEAPVREKKS